MNVILAGKGDDIVKEVAVMMFLMDKKVTLKFMVNVGDDIIVSTGAEDVATKDLISW